MKQCIKILILGIIPFISFAQSIELTPDREIKKAGNFSIIESADQFGSTLRLAQVSNNYTVPTTLTFAGREPNASVLGGIITHARVSSQLNYLDISHTYGLAQFSLGLATGTKIMIKSDSVITRVNAQHNGFTKLGSDAPAIKVKKLTGTTAPTQGTSVTINHSLVDAKILDIFVMVDYSTNSFIHPSYTLNPGYQFNWFSNSGMISVTNISGNSSLILSKPIKILITYEE